MKRATLSGHMPREHFFVRLITGNKQLIIEVISALFILLFLYTAIQKSIVINKTVIVLERTPWFSSFAQETAWAVVIIEYIIALLLFVPKTKKLGLYSSLLLMLGFTGYIIYMLIFVPDLPCTCGGVISKMTWSQHLIFNIFFILLAGIGIRLLKQQKEAK